MAVNEHLPGFSTVDLPTGLVHTKESQEGLSKCQQETTESYVIFLPQAQLSNRIVVWKSYAPDYAGWVILELVIQKREPFQVLMVNATNEGI